MDKKKNNVLYFTHHCEDSEQFIQYCEGLMDKSVYQRGRLSLFRGQRDANWSLLPRAWRIKEKTLEALRHEARNELAAIHNEGNNVLDRLTKENNSEPDKISNALCQDAAEYEAVRQFVELSDTLGMRLFDTDDLLDIRDFLRNPKEVADWPCFHMLKIFGLAQHHGIPTRLLDFSTDPMKAAWFAVNDAAEFYIKGHGGDLPLKDNIILECLEEDPSDEKLALWAIDYYEIPMKNKIKRLTCPRSEHTYLHAQSGQFLYLDRGSAIYLENGQWPSLDEIISENIEMDPRFPEFSPLKKITLPISSAPKALLLLEQRGVYKASLMPSFDNISEEVIRSWKAWDEITPPF